MTPGGLVPVLPVVGKLPDSRPLVGPLHSVNRCLHMCRQRGDTCGAGSIFVPTKQLLAQMRFRPWNGVYLSDHYLDSVEGAEQITHCILQKYYDADVIPLVESQITSVEELRRVEGMLEQAAHALKGALKQCSGLPTPDATGARLIDTHEQGPGSQTPPVLNRPGDKSKGHMKRGRE